MINCKASLTLCLILYEKHILLFYHTELGQLRYFILIRRQQNVENNRPNGCSYWQRNTCQGTSVCQNISILGNDCRKLIISVSLTGISPLAHLSIPVATGQYVSCLIQRTKRWAGRKICFLTFYLFQQNEKFTFSLKLSGPPLGNAEYEC